MLPQDSRSGHDPRRPVVLRDEAYGPLPILLGALLNALLSLLHLDIVITHSPLSRPQDRFHWKTGFLTSWRSSPVKVVAVALVEEI